MAVVTVDAPLLDESEAAKILKVSEQTLSNWRCNGRVDLPFVKLGRSVRYKQEDLAKHIDRNTHGGKGN